MLSELRVRQLGVVDDIALHLSPGMTVITGETGAGKTLLTEAIRLLTGGRAEAHVVRTGAEEAEIEGRFVIHGDERILSRAIPRSGRSRAYVDGRMMPLSALTELGDELVDLHGQHAHQALLSPVAQRRGLDAFGKIDLEPLLAARRRVHELDEELASLGGDTHTRARELDLLRFQLDELDAAELTDAEEDERLLAEENLLGDAESHREAAQALHEAIAGDGGAVETIAAALKAGHGRAPLADLTARLQSIAAELEDLSLESGRAADGLQDDPERLAAVQDRRAQLKTLQRKYGPELSDVLTYRDESRRRYDEIERHDERVAEIETQKAAALKEVAAAEAVVRKHRAAAAPKLATEVEARLHDLALPNARFQIEVGDSGAGDDVTFLLGPNPGMPLLPVAKAASGGELARSMLALRLALLESNRDVEPDTLIFDEVDAGIGGEAAVAVGKALAALAHGSSSATQILVVTHLAQVAAFADAQVTVDKQQDADNTVARVRVLKDDEREVELARMLSGRPDSESGRLHARELLDQAADVRQQSVIDLRGAKIAKARTKVSSK